MAEKNSIQVDMFSVGLGAAILIQFRNSDGGIVRVLADGGMGHGHYRPEGVRLRLPAAMAAFDGAHPHRIDLMIGTHYDGDHLKGLISIAKSYMPIREVWLPPIQDDSENVANNLDGEPAFLADRFFDDENDRELLRYLRGRHEEIEQLYSQEERVRNVLRMRSERESMPTHPFIESLGGTALKRVEPGSLDRLATYEEYFEEHEAHARSITGTGSAHESAEYDSQAPDLRTAAWRAHGDNSPEMSEFAAKYVDQPDAPAYLVAWKLGVLASIRKSTAAGAITASHLHKLVQALKQRKPALRPVCKFIRAGRPEGFHWDVTHNRFGRGTATGGQKLALQLLGPSDDLVRKHREKLPIGIYLRALVENTELIERKRITESNQLSYILTLEALGQKLLISGDSGCYDFRDAAGNFYPQLLAALKPLHVVQVAHHAGHNYDFYHSLLSAGFAGQGEPAHLLLSHAVKDPSRPSDAFRKFVAQVRNQMPDVRLLFTSEPDLSKVYSFSDLIAPVVPFGMPRAHGDVRLSYSSSEGGGRWRIEAHAVAV